MRCCSKTGSDTETVSTIVCVLLQIVTILCSIEKLMYLLDVGLDTLLPSMLY